MGDSNGDRLHNHRVGEWAPVISMFSAKQVRRLTGATARQLGYWSKTRFYRSVRGPWTSDHILAAYSFEDLVALRVIVRLRQRVPLQELRRVGSWLSEHQGSWGGRRFWVGGRRVFWDDDAGGRIGTRQPAQRELEVDMDEIARDLKETLDRANRRGQDQIGHIERLRNVAGHQPVIAGTRVPARAVTRLLDAGQSLSVIRSEYPTLTEDDVNAAIAWHSRGAEAS